MSKVIGFPESIEQIVREEEGGRLRKLRRAWEREKLQQRFYAGFWLMAGAALFVLGVAVGMWVR